MSDDNTTQNKKPGCKPPEGAKDRRQFLAVRNAELIKVVVEADITTYEMPERAARELLDLRKASRARRA
jgi:hypothetical protein